MARKILSWAPAAGAVVVVAAAAIAIPMSANASSTLPQKSVAQVLKMISSNKVDALSGTITQTSNLGLPSLPTSGAGSDSSVASDLALVTGSHDVRVYLDGKTKQRVQALDNNEEKDVIRNGSDLWLWDYTANTAKHYTIAAHTHRAMPGASSTPKTPAEVAKKLIAGLKSSSTVSVVSTDPDVAGRSVYDLVLTPKATDTLLGSVTISVDSATGLPLAVDIDARGSSTPAISVAFSKIDLSTPAASLFTFTAPSGAKVTQEKAPTRHARANHAHAKPNASKSKAAKPTTTGTGWDAVVTIPKQSSLAKFESSKQFSMLTTAVSGGRLFHTSLVNVLFETDGRVLVGSVSQDRLEAVAAGS